MLDRAVLVREVPSETQNPDILFFCSLQSSEVSKAIIKEQKCLRNTTGKQV